MMPLLLAVPLLLVTACEPAEDRETEAEGERSVITEEQRRDARRSIDSTLANVDDGIDRLEAEAAAAGEEIEEGYRDVIADIRQDRNRLDEDLEQLSDAAGEEFSRLRESIGEAADDLATRVDSLTNELQREVREL